MTESKTLSNVLLCSNGNNLKLADILFDDKILDIRYHSNDEINWENISTKEPWENFILT